MRKYGLMLTIVGGLALAGCGGATQPAADELSDDPVARCTRFVEHLQSLECAESILTADSCAALADLDPELVPDYDCLIAETFCEGGELIQPAPDACP